MRSRRRAGARATTCGTRRRPARVTMSMAGPRGSDVCWSICFRGKDEPVLVEPRLWPGERVRFVSPASTPNGCGCWTSPECWRSGPGEEVGTHLFDRHGNYLTDCDEDG